jgi:hypothetical protein
MRLRIILVLALLLMVAGCLFQPEKNYYDVSLGGSWGSGDSLTYCQNPGSRTYISFGNRSNFEYTTRFPDHVSVIQGTFSREKAKIRIEWDTDSTSCFTKTCNISDLVYEKCPEMKDSAIINKDGRISFRNTLYSRLQ